MGSLTCNLVASCVYRVGISLPKLHLPIAVYGGLPPCYYHYEIPVTEFSFQVYKCSWLRHYTTSRQVIGSIPDEVIGFFQLTKSFQPHYGPGVDSACNRNEYLGAKG
jgi:hypothetical protein